MRNVFLKGFPKGFWEEDIGRLATALGANVTSSMVWKDKRGKSRGVALVEVETEEQADMLTQVLRLRTIRRPRGTDLAASAGGVASITMGEGDTAWVLVEVDAGDKQALIVETAFREANYVKGPDDPVREPRVKEDPQEKQKRCEIVRKQRQAAKRTELEEV